MTERGRDKAKEKKTKIVERLSSRKVRTRRNQPSSDEAKNKVCCKGKHQMLLKNTHKIKISKNFTYNLIDYFFFGLNNKEKIEREKGTF